MIERLRSLGVIAAGAGLVACSGADEAAAPVFTYADGSPARVTEWGDPDLQGMWPIMHIFTTPLQRPTGRGASPDMQRVRTEEEIARAQASMDQRNANGGESSGPIPVRDPWGAFAEDQLGLMDHLGIREFFFMGYCIGGPFALKLMERAPDRIVAGVLCQPVGHRPENPDVMYNSGRDVWAPELRARRPDVTMETIEAYLHNLYRVQPDFVYSVSRDFVRACQTPMLVMPDDTPAHPYQVAMDVAALAPKAEVTVYPWREPKDLLAKTVNQVRDFLRAHQPVTPAR